MGIVEEPWCTLGDKHVDCGWLELADFAICSCSSTGCFAAIGETTNVSIDARYDEEAAEFSGSFIDGERELRRVYLSEDEQ